MANKLKIGQKVRAKQRLIDWHSSHLCWSYGVGVENDKSYHKEEKEIPERAFLDVYCWLSAKLIDGVLEGVVVGYGADPSTVKVDFTFKTIYEDVMNSIYVEERDLVSIGKKKK